MERWKMRALDLLSGLGLSYKSDPAVIPYQPSKTVLSKWEKPYFARVAAESVGLCSDGLAVLLETLEREPSVNLHNLLILKDGRAVVSCSAPGYDVGIPHLSHSMSKTVTGMAIGILADMGRIDIDAPVSAFFPEYTFRDGRAESMTVAHLLAMRSGVSMAEVGSVTEEKWTEAFFHSSLDFTPGEKFAYNSMNSYILGRIAERAAGCDLFSFVDEHIFRPMGITGAFWERGPEGFIKAGWGLYLTVESWAKLGQMILDRGRFDGKRILSERWVIEMVTQHSDTPSSMGDFRYGYHVWVGDGSEEILFNGMLGQNVWIYPKRRVVVAMQAGNNELFSASASVNILRRFFKEESPLTEHSTHPRRHLAQAEAAFFKSRVIQGQPRERGLAVLLGLRRADPYVRTWDSILGTYDFCPNNASVLPLFVRVMQNNYTGGIERLSLAREGNGVFLYSTEGSVSYKIEIGLYEYKQTVLNIRGERYLVRAIGAATYDENRQVQFQVELVYPELPNARSLTLQLMKDSELTLHLSEMPNHRIAESFFSSVKDESARTELLFRLIERRLGANFLITRVEEVFAPTLIGAKVGTFAYNTIMQREKSNLEHKCRESEFLRDLLARYTNGSDLGEPPRENGIMHHLRAIWRIARRPKGTARATGGASRSDAGESPSHTAKKDGSPTQNN